MLKVQALGTLQVSQCDSRLMFPSRKAEELLCYLLVYRGKALRRTMVAEALWPMRPPGRALRCLSTALWRLRQTLDAAEPTGSSCVKTERSFLQFVGTAGYWFDAEEFEKTARLGLGGGLPCDPTRREGLKQSLELYEGDFLAGLYSDWCLPERERLKLLFVRVLKRLLFHFHLCEAYDDAIEKGQYLLAIDPLQEDVHRELMRCYAQSGRRSQAIEQFEICQQVLREELRIAPMPETLLLRDQICDDRSSLVLRESAADVPLSLRQALTRFGQAVNTLEGAWHSLQTDATRFPNAEYKP